MGVADAELGDAFADVQRQRGNELAGQIFVLVQQLERAFFAGQCDTGAVGGMGDGAHDLAGHPDRFGRTVFDAQENEQVSQTGDADAHPAFGIGFGPLLRQRIIAQVDHVVQHAHGDGDGPGDGILVQSRVRRERIDGETGEVHGTEQAGAVRRQGLFAAGVGGADLFTIIHIVHFIDAVHQDESGFRKIVGGTHDQFPQFAGLDGLVDLAVEHQVPRGVGFDRFDEFGGDRDRKVEHLQCGVVALGRDEFFDVGMVAAHDAHLGAAALACAHDRAAGGIQDLHETQRTGSIGFAAFDIGSGRTDGGKVETDAAALFLGHGGFLDRFEDAVDRVIDLVHHETVEHGNFTACRAGVGDDAAARQEFVAGKDRIEFFFPFYRILLVRRDGVRDPSESVFR